MRIKIGLVVVASIAAACTAGSGTPGGNEDGLPGEGGAAGEAESKQGTLLPVSSAASDIVDAARKMARPEKKSKAAQRRWDTMFLSRPPRTNKSDEERSLLGKGASSSFLRVGDVIRPNMKLTKTALDFDLPVKADGAVRLRANDMVADVRLVGAQGVPAEASNDGFLVYRNALTDAHVLHRATDGADEDFLLLNHDLGNSEVTYHLALEKGVAGVRVISNAIELLDAKGVPRLRMAPPYLVDAAHKLQFLKVEVTGCSVSTSPAIPWEQPIVSTNTKLCTVHVKWNADAVAYPLLVDPSWSTTANMSVPRDFHTATTLTDGRVLVVGGEIGLGEEVFEYGYEYLFTHQTAEIYDPLFGVWTQTAAMHHRRQEHVAVRLASRRVLVVGGWNETVGDLISAEIYDPATGEWIDAPNAPGSVASRSTATLLPDNTVLVAGGRRYDTDDKHAYSQRFSEATSLWTATGPLNVPHSTHTAHVLPDGKVLIAGHEHGPASDRISELFDPSTNAWAQTTGLMGSRRGFHVGALLSTGKVLVAGGDTGGGTPSLTAELYDPSTQTWSAAASMNTPRSATNTAVTLPNGKVLVEGGLEVIGANPAITNVAELYDPTTNTWSTTSTLNTQRAGHTATLLPAGTVLVTGGLRWYGTNWPQLLNTTDSSEVY